MNLKDSPIDSTKDFINKLNQLLRDTNHYIDFTNGALHSFNQGYIAILEDDQKQLYLVEDISGEIVYESELNKK